VDLQATILFTTSLLAIVNPLAAAVLFVTTASRFSQSVQRRMAYQSALAVAVILVACVWAGRYLLLLLGISVPMLQAAGGLILLITGLRMVLLEETKLTPAEQVSVEDVPESHWKALAVVPVAIPGTVGAGTITTVVVQATTYRQWQDLSVITAIGLGRNRGAHVDHLPIGGKHRAAAWSNRTQHRDAGDGHSRHRHGVRPSGTRHRGPAAGPDVTASPLT
jgi:small neutral amino acid transporter SnatA (MarC family)